MDLKTNEKMLVHSLEDDKFGEGCVLLNSKIYQLTWRERVVFVYDSATLAPISTLDLPAEINEGWGICTDGTWFYIVNGSENIYVVDPDTFTVSRTMMAKW